MDTVSEARRNISVWWRLAPLLIFAVALSAKLALLLPYAQSPAGSDEIRYLQLAKVLASGSAYADPRFPPFFPLSLVPSLLFADVYRASIALSCVYSTALIFPVWLIVREMLDERHAAAAAVVVALLPFQYSMPRVVMSETLYYPLLMTAVYLITTERWRRVRARDALAGALIGALFLTRSMTAVFLPALALVWLVRERHRLGRWRPDRDLALRALLLAGALVAMLGLWALLSVIGGVDPREALQITRATNIAAPSALPPEALTLERFLSFAAAYLASWVLWLAPVLGLIGLGIVRLAKWRSFDLLDRHVVMLLATAVPLLLVATRWSWRGAYNWPVVLRIMDRYCIYLVALGLIVAFGVAGLWRREETDLTGLRFWAPAVAVPAVVVPISWWAVFRWGFLPPVSLATPGYATADTYHVLAMGFWFWVVTATVVVASAWELQRDGRRPYTITVIGLLVFFALGTPTYLDRALQFAPSHEHAVGIAEVAKRYLSEDAPVVVGMSRAVYSATGEERLARHVMPRAVWLADTEWGRLRVRFMSDRRPHETLRVYVEGEEGATGDVLARYRVGATWFVVVEGQPQ